MAGTGEAAAGAIWPAAREAAEMVEAGAVVGLGTGRAADMFLRALAERVRAGLPIRGVPTSERTERRARELGVPLASLDEIDEIDIDVDGADEVSPELDLIKGLGGALVRERVVASIARYFVVLAGEEKLVGRLGEKVALPVEVVPFAVPLLERQLAVLGGVTVRMEGGARFRSDNGNAILDLALPESPPPPSELQRRIRYFPGVVDTGFFIGMADLVLVHTPSGTRRLTPP